MKESIFFNREQLKIIRRYGIVYQLFFKYGMILFSFIGSLILLGLFFSSGFLSKIILFEATTPPAQEKIIFENYNNKENILTTLSGIDTKISMGEIKIESNKIKSQDILMDVEGLTLPRKINIEKKEAIILSQKSKEITLYEKDLKNFFTKIIDSPLQTNYNNNKTELIKLNTSLQDLFGLQCINTSSKVSFVCKHRISNFLKHFFYYNLGKAEPNNKYLTEIKDIYTKIKNNEEYKDKLCKGIIQYGKYGGDLDESFTAILSSCEKKDYKDFIILKDFTNLSNNLALGFADAKTYSNKQLNEYKLFSLQQILYNQIVSSIDIKTTMTSYFQFLREVLIKEGNRNIHLLGNFAKTFSYRYNTNILYPYLKDEKSKMNKEDKSALIGQLLSLNYGDKIANFKGLEEQSLYKKENKGYNNETRKEFDLEKLFRSSYLPNDFSLTSVKKINENTIIINGIDRETELTISARLEYKDIQLIVTEMTIKDNNKLTEFMNTIIKNDNYSLNKALRILSENKNIAEQTKKIDINLCLELKEEFKEDLITCNDNKIKIIVHKGEKEKDIEYTFSLTKGSLSNLEVSDKELEVKLLKEIDFKLLDPIKTQYIIPSLIGYIPKEKNAGFGMKEHIFMTDKMVKYLGVTPKEVSVEGTNIRTTFDVQGIHFIGIYDPIKNELNPIGLDFGTKRRPIFVQNFSLELSDNNTETLNKFTNAPLEYLKSINKALIERYFPEKEQ